MSSLAATAINAIALSGFSAVLVGAALALQEGLKSRSPVGIGMGLAVGAGCLLGLCIASQGVMELAQMGTP